MDNLFEVAELNGIEVTYFNTPENGAQSATLNGNCYIALDYGLMWQRVNERVHLAHELGHCLTGSFYNIFSPFDLRSRHERRADKWAIKKLVPENELKELLSYMDKWEVAEHFEVTIDFLEKAIAFYKGK
ncbi:MAG: ImmA/IrrE family metallo-endopeptidase [Ruminococcaceae bacterium]|nr:ImmA/IrrE family metallo-endopeptidase [Oscillospiraceae bacterium]